jgi:hypothetical protein
MSGSDFVGVHVAFTNLSGISAEGEWTYDFNFSAIIIRGLAS